MTNKEINLLMIEKFPQLQNAYEEEVSWQEGDDTGSHVVYGDIFTYYIESEILKGADTTKIFDFIEEAFLSGDQDFDNVMSVTVLEYLLLNDKLTESDIFPHLKPLSKKAWNALKKDLL